MLTIIRSERETVAFADYFGQYTDGQDWSIATGTMTDDGQWPMMTRHRQLVTEIEDTIELSLFFNRELNVSSHRDWRDFIVYHDLTPETALEYVSLQHPTTGEEIDYVIVWN